jgi:hypothetical protein
MMARKPNQPAAALGYVDWKAAASALLTQPTTMREREWKRLYVQNATPQEAARHAETYTYNRRVTAGRKKR